LVLNNHFQYTLTISLVVYNTNEEILMPLINSINQIKIPVKLIVIDNSDRPNLQLFFEKTDAHYVFNNHNLGYGKAHNKAIEIGKSLAPFHLIVNPDVVINLDCVENGINFLIQHLNVGLLMPKVLYPNGQIQHLCKLLPTPFNLIFRRFIPKSVSNSFKKSLNEYELLNKDYNKKMFLNNLSGCFMLIPHEVLNKTGKFDENFFMYLEDTDLSRRISAVYDAVYLPSISIIHNYEKGSYKNKKLLLYHIKSAIYYFNKWGWFFDKERIVKNKKVLQQVQD